jgi:hypothetical protein
MLPFRFHSLLALSLPTTAAVLMADLATLRVLNAANNAISSLSNLNGCACLEKLLLQGNKLASLDSLPALPRLRQLTLRTADGATNPLYEDGKHSNAAAADLAILNALSARWPTVLVFNGGHTVGRWVGGCV